MCRHCFGRLVSSLLAPGEPDVRRWTCTNCGASADGACHDALCACGIRLRHPTGPGEIDAGIRCQPNPSPSPEFPSLFVAGEPRT